MSKLLLATAALSIWAAAPAQAHSWYPPNCCSGQDCEPIPIDGIVETNDGYHVTYLSQRFGPIDEYVPRQSARLSEDGGFHGCWRKAKVSPRQICFFAPVNVQLMHFRHHAS